MNTERRRALVFLNATAGTGKAGSRTFDIVKRLAEDGFEPILYPVVPGTELVSEKILEEYDGKADLIVCSGGDGTLNHIVQSVMQMKRRPSLAYLPTGSTNDFAKGLGISTVFNKGLETAVRGKPFRYDVGALNDRYFNYVAAFGAFSAVSYATDQQLKNSLGHAAYILSAMAELPQNLSYRDHIRIETEDEVLEDSYLFGAICNTVSVGGFEIFKSADVSFNDGKMELLLIRTPKTPLELQGIISALLRGTFDHPAITLKKISEADLVFDSNTAWALDGEFGGEYSRVRFRVEREAIEIMSGK